MKQVKDEKNSNLSGFDRAQSIMKVVLTLFWITLVVLCIIYKEDITVDNVLRFTPASPVLAALAMIVLFGLKSICVVVWIGVLYAASGIMFPLYEAIAINVLGTAVMVTIPYVLGRSEGRKAISYAISKYPKLKMIQDFGNDDSFFFYVVLRSNGILPDDIMSLYLGAVEMPYPKFMATSLIGQLPLMLSFPIMSPYLANPLCPEFMVTFAVNIVIMAASFAAIFFMKRKSLLK